MDKESKEFPLSVFDLAILMLNVYKAEADPRLSECNDNYRFNYLMKKANRGTKINIGALESCLWACNMLEELGEFWHPQGLDLDAFLQKIKLTKEYKFDKLYNVLEKKRTHGKT